MHKRLKHSDIVVGLDIGTTKICAMVAKLSDSEINVIGIGTCPTVGLKKGVIVDIESTVESIKKAIVEAELMSGQKISSVYTGIAGSHITGLNSRGIIPIEGPEITPTDIKNVIDAARAIAIPTDRKIIHVLPQEYTVDNQSGIQNPVGMAGVRLEAKIHIVTGSVTSVHNVVKCANKAGLDVCDIVLESLASGEAVLTNEERELGSALIDLGGGTTDLAIFKNKNIKHTFVLALGGDNLTRDIAIGIRTPISDAEKIKKKLKLHYSEKEEMIDIQGIGHRESKQISHKIINEIVELRIEEIFSLIHDEITRIGMKKLLSSGIVISGGTSLLGRAIDIAESVFEMPVRTGIPKKINGLSDVITDPIYATSAGLVLYGAKKLSERKANKQNKNIIGNLVTKTKQWFMDVI